MIIGLLRHAIAQDADQSAGITDDLRELTFDGARRMRSGARGIGRLGLGFDVVITSPLVRCVQTAEIVARELGVPARAIERLRPGLDADRLVDVLLDVPDANRILVCGHQPDMSDVAYDLLRGGVLEFKKGALAVVELGDPPRPGSGVLLGHYPPSALRGLGAGEAEPGEAPNGADRAQATD